MVYTIRSKAPLANIISFNTADDDSDCIAPEV